MKRWILLDILFLLVLMAYVLAGYTKVPLHGDEPTHIYMSRDYYYLVQARDLDPVLYKESPQNPAEQELRILNGTVHKMFIGFAWDLAGLTIADVNEQWVWEWTWDQNAALGHIPSDDLLHAARLSSALLTALSVVLVFGITRVVTGHRLAAWAASLIYATNPAVLLNGRRAMMEGAMLFFTALLVLIGVIMVRQQGRARIGWYAALGLAGGFAVASKHNAVVVVAAVFVAVAAVDWWATRRGDSHRDSSSYSLAHSPTPNPSPVKREGLTGRFSPFPPGGGRAGDGGGFKRFQKISVAGVLVPVTFLALNPAWWSDPLGMPEHVLTARSDLLDGQIEQARQNGDDAYNHIGDRVAGLINEAFFAGPQYYEVPVWQDYIGDEIESYERSGLAGRSGGAIWGVLLVVLVIVGVGAMLALPVRVGLALPLQQGISPALVILIVFGVTALALLIATPFEWQRYYLLLHLPVAVIAGIGLSWVGHIVN